MQNRGSENALFGTEFRIGRKYASFQIDKYNIDYQLYTTGYNSS